MTDVAIIYLQQCHQGVSFKYSTFQKLPGENIHGEQANSNRQGNTLKKVPEKLEMQLQDELQVGNSTKMQTRWPQSQPQLFPPVSHFATRLP